jgi:hypothetical protein
MYSRKWVYGMKIVEKAIYRQLLIGAILGILAITCITLVIMSVSNPLVEYQGVKMRKSTMLAERTGEVFCQQMSSFSLGVMYTCFDSQAELEVFADSQ